MESYLATTRDENELEHGIIAAFRDVEHDSIKFNVMHELYSEQDYSITAHLSMGLRIRFVN